MFQLHDQDLFDLMLKFLDLNPKKRITADEALSHTYFKEYIEITDLNEKNAKIANDILLNFEIK